MIAPFCRPSLAAILSMLTVLPLAAQEDPVERIAFAGGEITITENDDFEKIVAFDGRELVRDYTVSFDGMHTVAGIEVAFFSAGPGGNACGPSAVMVWKPEGSEVTAERMPDDCGAPPPALTEDRVYFVPYLLPGDTGEVTAWSPDDSFSVTGSLAYVPQPGTTWEDLDPAAISHPLDLFRNADLYAATESLLGDALTDYAAGLSTAAGPEDVGGGLLTARGCVPHACGLSDSFLALDLPNRTLYLAQQSESGAPETWPALSEWPEPARSAMEQALEQ